MEWLPMYMKNTSKLKINSIFYSIQGEGCDNGIPTIFIRLAGCNLRCSYCDTKYAYYEGNEMEIDEIFKEIKKWDCKRVCITGGEPLLQNNIYKLIDFLLHRKYEISVETNGSIDISKLSLRDIVIKMDLKCPSSGMHKKMRRENINLLRERDELKFIIDGKEDYEYAKKIINEYKPLCNIIFQPVWGDMEKARKIAEWILKDNINARFSIQIHKILWRDEREADTD